MNIDLGGGMKIQVIECSLPVLLTAFTLMRIVESWDRSSDEFLSQFSVSDVALVRSLASAIERRIKP